MSDQLESNTLSVSADAVRELIADSDALAAQSVDKAIEAGQLLVTAKEECRHGEWLPFLKRAGVPERKAQRYMTLARSGLKSDAVTDLGGMTAALEFLAARAKAVEAFDAAYANGAIDTRLLRVAIKQVDQLCLRFGSVEAGKIVRAFSAEDAFIDAIEGRGLPKPGSHLEITAHQGDQITAIGAVWPSVGHEGFYYCAVMQHNAALDEDIASHVVWTKRPVSGSPFPIDGIIHEPVWDFFATHMGAPASIWDFDESGVLPEILAEHLDLPFLISEQESGKKWRDADSAAAADLLESAGIVPPYPDYAARVANDYEPPPARAA